MPDAIQEEVEKLKERLTSLDDRLNAVDQRTQGLPVWRGELGAQIEKVRSLVADLQAQADGLTKAVEEQKNARSEINSRIKSLEERAQELGLRCAEQAKPSGDFIKHLTDHFAQETKAFREHLEKLVDFSKNYSVIVLAGGGLAVLGVLVSGAIKTKELSEKSSAEMERISEDFRGRLLVQVNAASNEVAKLASQEAFRTTALEAGRDQFAEEFRTKAAAASYAGVIGTLARVRIDLTERLRQPQPDRLTVTYGERYFELIASIADLQQTYAKHLSQGELDERRLNSLLITVNGILEMGDGFFDRARSFFETAAATDGRFPEPLLFQANLHLRKMQYYGDGKWSDTNEVRSALRLWEQAQRLPEALRNLEARKARSLVSWATGKFDEAIREATIEIDRERSEGLQPDPRMYARLARYYWDRASDTKNPEDLRAAAANFLEAAKLDDRSVNALNNYLWVSVHKGDDSLVEMTRLSGTELELFRNKLAQFEQTPIVSLSAGLQNTLAEGLYFLKDSPLPTNARARAISAQEKAAKLALEYELSTNVVNFLTNRLDKMRKNLPL